MTPTIREMQWPDLPQVEALERLLFPADPWPSASWWAELARRPRRQYVVAVTADRVVGFAGADHGGEVSDIMTVAVDPGWQGRGLGRKLLRELEDRARAAGAADMVLEVRADNAAGIALYERAGYALVRTRRRYYQPGDVDALVLRKSSNAVGRTT